MVDEQAVFFLQGSKGIGQLDYVSLTLMRHYGDRISRSGVIMMSAIIIVTKANMLGRCASIVCHRAIIAEVDHWWEMILGCYGNSLHTANDNFERSHQRSSLGILP